MKGRLGQGIALLVGLALCGVSVAYQAAGGENSLQDWFRIASNAALIPGVLYLGVSAMLRISGEGVFDALRYSLSTLLAHFRGETKRYPSYYDYLQREKKARASYPMLLPGVLFLGAAVALTLLYYAVDG